MLSRALFVDYMVRKHNGIYLEATNHVREICDSSSDYVIQSTLADILRSMLSNTSIDIEETLMKHKDTEKWYLRRVKEAETPMKL